MLEGGQCRRAVAAPVVQAHHAAMRMLGRRRFEREPLGEGQRFGDAAFGFELCGMPCQLHSPLAGPTFASARDPGGQIVAVGVVQRAEQRRRAGPGCWVECRCASRQIVVHTIGERHQRGRDEDLGTGTLAQPEQALAEVGLCGAVGQFGPQQAQQAAAGCRAAQCEPGEQGGIATFQNVRLALRQLQPRHTKQFEAK